ncbi:MAG: hydroxymethylglutaryl-CoA synthase [Chloroflexota bacterium]
MSGIVSYGAYVPIYRLSGEVLSRVWGSRGKGERAVANVDEDSITMAVEAALDCLNGIDRTQIDALYLASTTLPYKEKLSASIVAAACDLRDDLHSADFTSSLRAAASALQAALDAVTAGSARQVLVVASDSRLPHPGSASELLFGDGAAAFIVGKDGVIAEVEGSHALSSEFLDVWRLDTDAGPRTWEERFIIEEGYNRLLPAAVSGLLKKLNASPQDFAKAVFYAPDARTHTAMARTLNLDANKQVQNPLFDVLGNTGAAFAPMLLVAALEEARAGDRVLFGTYGDGAAAFSFRTTGKVEAVRDRRGVKRHLSSKDLLTNYGKYIRFRNLMEPEPSLEYRFRTSLPLLWRDRKMVYRLRGHRCRQCGNIQFPMQNVCIYCQARKDFDEVRLSDKKGSLFTFSLDERTPVPDPPNVLAAVDLDGGGRLYGQVTDRDPAKIKVGMRMEPTFRRIHDALGIHNYFWKLRPCREQ